MAINKGNKKIVRYKRHFWFNIGTLLFGLILVYILINIGLLLTTSHVAIYEVTADSLTGNYHFTALALKSERIVTAQESGTISYYAAEGGKIGAGNSVYSINENGETASTVSQTTQDITFSTGELSNIRSESASFAENFDKSSFQSVYNFKSNIQSSILDLIAEKSVEENNTSLNTLNSYTAPESGIIVYSTDGFEEVTASDVTLEMFDQKNYVRTNLREDRTVQVGDPVYKLLTDEDWSLIIPLTDSNLAELSERTQIRFRFLKDGTSFNADFSIIQNGDNYFGKLDISNSLIRFASDRFIEIELVLSRETGLKVPNSALIVKDLFRIPKEYAVYTGDNPDTITLTREGYANDGSAVVSDVTVSVYQEDEDAFYIDDTVFELGDYVIKDDQRFHIVESEQITGVYNVNMGYAVFSRVTVQDSNEEYSIVEAANEYILAQYDHIVLDASTVAENQIIF